MRLIVPILALLLATPSVADTLSKSLTSASCTSTNTTGCIVLASAAASVSVQLSGTWTATIAFEGSNDASTYTSLRAWPVAGGEPISGTINTGAWLVDTGGLRYVRVRVAEYTSGTISATVSDATARPVLVDVGLTGTTLSTLGTAVCTVGVARRVALTTTAEAVPSSGALEGRSAITVINVSSVSLVACEVDQGNGTLPDCSTPGVGLTLYPYGGSVRFPTPAAVLCRSCSGSATVEYVEESCT